MTSMWCSFHQRFSGTLPSQYWMVHSSWIPWQHTNYLHYRHPSRRTAIHTVWSWYWCQDKFPIDVLAAAIRCYNDDIHSSPQWSQLQAYSQLCTLFPKPSPMYPNFDPTTILSDYTPTKAERRLFDQLSGTLCPKAVHSKPDLESSRSRKHHRQAYHQVITNCRNNQRIHALYLQSNDLDHSHLQHLADILPTTHIYAINLGEAKFSSDSLQFLHDFLPNTSITQIYLHHHSNTKLLQNIQRRTDQNRAKVKAH